MNSRIDQLKQITSAPVWDGNLISKYDRDELVKSGLVGRHAGWNYLTGLGIQYAVDLAWLVP